MAPKKNKRPTPKGPYYFFMMEYKKRQEAAGHQFRGGNHEVQLKASPYWNAMSPEEKEPYNKMAQEHREFVRASGEKFTSQGVPLSMVVAEQFQRKAKSELIRDTISNMLDAAVAKNELEKLELYFISFAYFCVTSNGTYIPAEMGVVRYSLKEGIMDKLHMFIDPGKLPLGMAFDAKQLADSEHQLPIPPDAMGEKDNDEIILKLFSFLSQQEKMPPIFTDTNDIKMVDNIIKGILNRGSMDEKTLLVCPLAELFYQLKRATESFGMDIKTFPSVYIAQAIIQKDVYEYTKDIACDFHEELGNGKYCPLSRCMRWAFIISDSCCLDLSIEMKPGRHLPKNADTALCSTDIADSSSYISTQMDNCSFVSSSELTHLTHPTMQKLPKSHYSTDDKLNRRSMDKPGTSRIKEEYPSLSDSMKYEASSSSGSRRDSRSAWDSSSNRDSSSYRESSHDSYDRRDRDRDRERDRIRERDREREFERIRERERNRGRDLGLRRDSDRDRRDSDRDRRDSDRDRRVRDYERRASPVYYRKDGPSSRTSSDYASSRVKSERGSSDSDDDGLTSRSSDTHRSVGGYGRGSLAAPRSPPRIRDFTASDFPALGAVRSAGRGQLSK